MTDQGGIIHHHDSDCGCGSRVGDRNVRVHHEPRAEDRLAAARSELEVAGWRWHIAAEHPGTYDECNEKSCYHTNRLVSR